MRYLLTLYGDESTWGSLPDEDSVAELEAFASFEREAAEGGVLVARAALQPPAEATTIRAGAAEPRAAAGPAREGRSQAGCFYLLECADAEEAEAWAKKLPLVGRGGFDAVEIRATME